MGFDLGGGLLGGLGALGLGALTGGIGLIPGGVGAGILGGGLLKNNPLRTPAQPQMGLYPDETDLLNSIKDILSKARKDSGTLWPILLAQAGYKTDSKGNFIRMSEADQLAAMTPEQRSQYQIQKSLLQREQAAISGTLPLDVGMQQEMDRQRKINEGLLAQKMGPDWNLSTAGIQTKARQNMNDLATIDAYRRNEMNQGMNLLSANQAQMANALNASATPLTGYAGRNLGLLSGYQIPLNTYASLRGANTEITKSNQAAKSAETAGLYGLLGTGAGILGAAALV